MYELMLTVGVSFAVVYTAYHLNCAVFHKKHHQVRIDYKGKHYYCKKCEHEFAMEKY